MMRFWFAWKHHGQYSNSHGKYILLYLNKIRQIYYKMSPRTMNSEWVKFSEPFNFFPQISHLGYEKILQKLEWSNLVLWQCCGGEHDTIKSALRQNHPNGIYFILHEAIFVELIMFCCFRVSWERFNHRCPCCWLRYIDKNHHNMSHYAVIRKIVEYLPYHGIMIYHTAPSCSRVE